MPAATSQAAINAYGFRAFPTISNQFQSLFNKLFNHGWTQMNTDQADITGDGGSSFGHAGAGDVPAGHRPALRRQNESLRFPRVSDDFQSIPITF